MSFWVDRLMRRKAVPGETEPPTPVFVHPMKAHLEHCRSLRARMEKSMTRLPRGALRVHTQACLTLLTDKIKRLEKDDAAAPKA